MTTSTQSVDTPLHHRSAADLSAGYAAGHLSPVDVVEAVIARVEEKEPVLNAFYRFEPEAARAAARASAHRWADGAQLGPLDGVPVTLKENIAVKGLPMPGGTAARDAVVADHDAPITERVREAGGVVLGTTTMPDWGMLSSGVSSLHGISRNPWNPAWTTGGSSAGAGAAAAAGYAPLNVGTDIGGSVRLPATWQGLVALKPSAGRIALDTPYLGRAAGPLTRTVADAAAVMGILSLPDVRDYTRMPYQDIDWADLDRDVRGLRIGVHTDAGAGAITDREVATAVEQAVDVFADAGAEIVEIPPFINQGLLDDLDDFWRVRFYAQYRAMAPAEQRQVLPYIAQWCARGGTLDGATAVEKYDSIAEMRRATILATSGFDLVLSPVAPMAAFPAEQPMPFSDPETTMTHIAFTVPYNMSGQPASSVNCGFTSDGRPIGLQIAGRSFQDLAVLQATAWYEANRPADADPVWPA
ncbi:amidase [Georgenia sp. AZ-5]|uniref:amidase n=1 Tax=Georgenia sp. AZ-5 TaxID=3367526 RepID=UPI00375521EF